MFEINRKVGLLLQIAAEVATFITGMDEETVMLSIIGILLLPFIVGSLWVLGISIVWELFKLGVKAAMILFALAGLYMTYLKSYRHLRGDLQAGINALRFRKWRNNGSPAPKPVTQKKPDCSLMDIVLTVYFQSGLWVPSFIWEFFTDLTVGTGEEKSTAVKETPTRANNLQYPRQTSNVNHDETDMAMMTDEDESSTDNRVGNDPSAVPGMRSEGGVAVTDEGIAVANILLPPSEESRGTGSRTRRRGPSARTRSSRKKSQKILD